MRVQKWCAAGDAEEFGDQRLRFVETGGTNRDAGNLAKELAADAAIVGENQGKQATGEPPRSAEHNVRQWDPATKAGQATRENPPPPYGTSVQQLVRVSKYQLETRPACSPRGSF